MNVLVVILFCSSQCTCFQLECVYMEFTLAAAAVMHDKFFQVCKMVHTVQRAPLNSDLELKLARNSHKLKKHTHWHSL